MTMQARLPSNLHEDRISANQAQTPGWSSPWMPGSRGGVGINRYSSGDDIENLGITRPQDLRKQKTRWERFQSWLIRSAFAPLFFRIFNLAFTACILAVAIVSVA